MFTALKTLYREAGRYALACPLAFLVPVFFEGLQHVVEWKLGLFNSRAAAHAVAGDPWRIGFGSLKVLALLLPGYWMVRWLQWGDPRRAVAWDPPAVRAYGWVFLLGAMLAMATLWGEQFGTRGVARGFAIFQLAMIPVGLLLVQWGVAAALGDRDAGPVRSARIMAPDMGYAFLFLIAATLPLMAVHYALNYAAMGRPPALAVPLTIVDAVFVGYQIAVMSGAHWFMARHALARRGIPAFEPA